MPHAQSIKGPTAGHTESFFVVYLVLARTKGTTAVEFWNASREAMRIEPFPERTSLFSI
jgi:hypothetical protein